MQLNEHGCCVVVTFKMTEPVEQQICIKFCVKLEHSSTGIIWMIQKAAPMGNWWLAASSQQCSCSCITSHEEFFWQTWNHPSDSAPYSPVLVPCNFWFFPKLKSPLKGKKFQTVYEIQENMMGQVMTIGRTVWGPRVPTLKGTETSLSYVCFLYLVSSSINISIFHIIWLNTFWTDILIYEKGPPKTGLSSRRQAPCSTGFPF